jgi:type II secretory pathway predicted ATPase ExeA
MSAPSPRVDLRPYQADVIARLREAIAAGQRRPLLVAPTGAGKTVIAAAIVERALQRRTYRDRDGQEREQLQVIADNLVSARTARPGGGRKRQDGNADARSEGGAA